MALGLRRRYGRGARRGAQLSADAGRGNRLVPILAEAIVVDVELRGPFDTDDDGGVLAPAPLDQDVVADLMRAAATGDPKKRDGRPGTQVHVTNRRAPDPATTASRACP